MPSPLKNILVLKASNEGIVVQWCLAPRWHLLEGHLSIGITIHGCCTGRDTALIGPRLILDATIWNLLHPTVGSQFIFLIALKKAAYTSCLINDKSSLHCATRRLFHFCDNCNLVSIQFSQLKV